MKALRSSAVRNIVPRQPCLRHLRPVQICPLGSLVPSQVNILALQLYFESRRSISSPHRAIDTPRREKPQDDTIYALSTAPGKAAIAIIRCSGPTCLDIYRSLCPETKDPNPRYATLRTLYSPADSQVLDASALVLYFPGPKTVTGEDVLELHVHGGTAVVKAVLEGISVTKDALGRSLRYAEPGEFTRRAFYNNRLDLAQVEALGDVLAAETAQQRKIALRGSSNRLTQRYEAWREQLLAARGELEALIDFAEDHDIGGANHLLTSVADQVKVLNDEVSQSIKSSFKGELLRNGIKVALLGAPNAGKSSLLNIIVGREAAIVSREAGTTRDVVEVGVDIGGYLCRFEDLAGLREAEAIGVVEKEGIRRARKRVLEADVVLVILPFEEDPFQKGQATVRMNQEVLDVLSSIDKERQRVLFVLNKTDLVIESDLSGAIQALQTDEFFAAWGHPVQLSPISCHTTSPTSSVTTPDVGGIQGLLSSLTNVFKDLTNTIGGEGSWEESLSASERQRGLLLQCQAYLEGFLSAVPLSTGMMQDEESGEFDVVVAAEMLRAAATCLGKITGRDGADVEEVLGVVFEKFCVGK
jgi:tRNA modification GTPase